MAEAGETENVLTDIKKKLGGEWVLKKSENLDAYLKEIGVSFMLRKMAGIASSTMKITIEGNCIHIVTTTGPKTSDIIFELKKEFVTKDPNDNDLKAIVSWENDVLITDCTPAEGSQAKPTVVNRKIEEDKLVMTVTANGVSATRIFKKKK